MALLINTNNFDWVNKWKDRRFQRIAFVDNCKFNENCQFSKAFS